jgi:hypothetical protein
MTSYYEQIIEDILDALAPTDVGRAIDLLRTRHHVGTAEAFEMLVRNCSEPQGRSVPGAATMIGGFEEQPVSGASMASTSAPD